MHKSAMTQAGALAKGALAVYLQPKLAQDAKVDLDPVLTGIRSVNFKAQIPALVLGVMKATRGKLAKDADIEDVAEVIEALAEILPPEAEAEVKEAVEGAEGETGGEVTEDDDDQLRALLKAKGLSDEEIDAIIAKGAPAAATDEKDEDDKKDKAMDAKAMDTAIKAATKGMVPRAAMDREIAASVARAVAETTAHINGIAEARRRVAPWVGELAMDFDSVEAVERKACDVLGIKHVGKHAHALMDIIESKPKANEALRQPAPRTAMDAAQAKSFSDRFGTDRIRHAA